MEIPVIKINSEVELPEIATAGSAGIDFKVNNFISKYSAMGYHIDEAYIKDKLSIPLHQGERLLIGTGLKVSIPKGYMMDVRSRSGNALKKGLVVANSPGTIDSDYRGEIGVILANIGQATLYIAIGDKVAQGVLMRCNKIDFKLEEILDSTERNEGGFGSTDAKN